jgi:molybdate transport system ATP-binding protein
VALTLSAAIGLQRGALALDVSLHAGGEGVLALLGPNGAGKSTILRALAGLEPLAAGRVVLGDVCLEDAGRGVRLPPERRGVGLVPQDVVLFAHLTVLDNVAFGLRCRGSTRREARRRARGWLDRLGVAAVASVRPRALSGGQAQRVALARALATEPRLLLLDEPLAAVDASARADLRRALRHHLGGHAGVRILVTHDPLDAAALASRVAIIEAGRVVQHGTFHEVTARPRSTWVARLAGLNLVRGDIVGGVMRVDGGAALTVPDEVRGPALATIHPRAIALHRLLPEGSPRNVLRGTVAGVDRDGERARVEVDGEIPLVAEVTAAAAAELRLDAGGPIFASIKSTEIDVYPA